MQMPGCCFAAARVVSALEALPTVEQWMRGSGTRKAAAALVVTWMYDDRDAETKKTATTQLFSAFLHAERDATLLPLCEMYVKV